MYDTIIIGAGISGCSAAMYAARKRMNYLFIAERFGGQSYESDKILNYPGIVEISGFEFASALKKQMAFNDVKLKEGVIVDRIKKKESYFIVKTNKGDFDGKTVIIATGAKPRKLGVPGEDKLAGRGVMYCAICDGPLFAGKTIAVVGGGNSALEAVNFMEKLAKKIYVINISEKFTAHEYLQEKILKNKKIEIISGAKTTKVLGEKMVTGIEYEQKGKKKSLKIEGVFVEIGRSPNTEFAKGFLEMDNDGHIMIDCGTATSMHGIFASGDCASGHEYQYAIAAGQGCMALLKAARYLARNR